MFSVLVLLYNTSDIILLESNVRHLTKHHLTPAMPTFKSPDIILHVHGVLNVATVLYHQNVGTFSPRLRKKEVDVHFSDIFKFIVYLTSKSQLKSLIFTGQL